MLSAEAHAAEVPAEANSITLLLLSAFQVVLRVFKMLVYSLGRQPFLVLKQSAKRQGDLPVLISFRAGWKGAGIAQDVEP